MEIRGAKLVFELGSQIGRGGNGNVHELISIPPMNEKLVVKVLNVRNTNNSSVKYERFKREIESMINLCKEVDGIMPIIDYCLPEKPSKENPACYVMPYAEPFRNVVFNRGIDLGEKLNIAKSIAKILCKIHDMGFAHRDLKVDNLLFLDTKVVISDFGLVFHSDYDELTREKEHVGPWNTISPEMKRGAYSIKDPRPADVYSFAKLLWIIITEDESCFEGQYEKHKMFSLKSENYSVEYLECIHELIHNATDDNMYSRPSMQDVITHIDKWFNIVECKELMREEVRRIIGREIRLTNLPEIYEYTDFDKIFYIMNKIRNLYSINSKQIGEINPVLYKRAALDNCLEIHCHNKVIVTKPEKLILIKSDVEIDKYFLNVDSIDFIEAERLYNGIVLSKEINYFESLLTRGLDVEKKIIQFEEEQKIVFI